MDNYTTFFSSPPPLLSLSPPGFFPICFLSASHFLSSLGELSRNGERLESITGHEDSFVNAPPELMESMFASPGASSWFSSHWLCSCLSLVLSFSPLVRIAIFCIVCFDLPLLCLSLARFFPLSFLLLILLHSSFRPHGGDAGHSVRGKDALQ